MKQNAFLIFLLFLCQYAVSQKISVYPTTLEFELASPGKTQTQVLNITNNSDINQAIEIYTGDWTRNADGGHSYFEPGTQLYSCAEWISVNTKFLNIPPGQTSELVVTLQAPEDASKLEAMKWAMLYIQGSKFRERIEDKGNGVQTRVNELMRFGIHIYQTPPSLNLVSAKLASLSPSNEGKDFYDVEVVNDGSVMLRAKSFLELTNVNTGEEFKSESTEFPIFPLGRRKVLLQLPDNLPKGEYSMLAILDYGNPDSLEAIEKIVKIE